jgi:fibronectin-binding autotransporter adhesin
MSPRSHRFAPPRAARRRPRIVPRVAGTAALGLAAVLALSPLASASPLRTSPPLRDSGVLARATSPSQVVPTAHATVAMAMRGPVPAIVAMRHAPGARGEVRPRAGLSPTTFTVTTTEDSPLKSPTSTACVDAATGKCSLRAAIGAANNLGRAAVVALGPHTYTLSDSTDGALEITNRAGTSVVGAGEATTILKVPAPAANPAAIVEDDTGGLAATGFLSELTVTGGAGVYGGGLEVTDLNASLVLDHVDVTHNTATDGGGVACYEGGLWATDSTISGNTAETSGGGLYAYLCDAYLTRTSVNADKATTSATGLMGGGGVYAYFGNVWMTGCTISNDTAGNATFGGDGGGIDDTDSGETLVGSTIAHDTVQNDGQGGGEYDYRATVDATRTVLAYDHANGATGDGGGLALVGGSQVRLHHVTLSHDATGATDATDGGGGIFVYSAQSPTMLVVDQGSQVIGDGTSGILAYQGYGGGDLTVSGSTIKNNTASAEGAGGLMVFASQYGGFRVSLTSDTISGNRDTLVGGAGGVQALAVAEATVALTVTGCVVQGNVASGANSTGGILGEDTSYGAVSVEVDGTRLAGNRAPDAGEGGGVAVFQYNADGHASLSLDDDLILSNTAGTASASGVGGGVLVANFTLLQVTDCHVEENVAVGGATGGMGGGIYDDGYLAGSIDATTLLGNRATGTASEGGGLYALAEYGATDVTTSTIRSNSASEGGGIFVSEYQLRLDASSVLDNTATDGGGLYNVEAVVSVTNDTFTGNNATAAGGAIYDFEQLVTLWFTTVSGNAAPQGGGWYGASSSIGTIRDSILAGNHTTPKGAVESECHAAKPGDLLGSLGDNVLSRATCLAAPAAGDVVTTNPGLQPVRDNGGPTMTMALLAKSPALGRVTGDRLATDQRGVARPSAGPCDAGAYEHAVPRRP